jgi:hypothetical protein
MDAVGPRLIDEWLAYDAIEPIPVPWAQSAGIAAEVYRVTQTIAATHGVKTDNRPPADWIPTRTDPKAESRPMSIEELDRAARRMAGL